MPIKVGTYDTDSAKQISLKKLLAIFTSFHVKKVYVKKLAPNDNSKNQPYFGAHLTDLSFIPTNDIQASFSGSNKTTDPKRQVKYQANLKLSWVDAEGKAYPASSAKLIYYPQYPEVRFSGFLQGSKVDISRWMLPQKEGRSLGRWLILGVSEDKTVYSYLASPESMLSNELENISFTKTTSIFGEIDIQQPGTSTDTRANLIAKLLEIHEMGWIFGQKLGPDMIAKPYKAQNGGGYTLESMLGISPNGFSKPDYLGWEVKQFGVKAFPNKGTKPTTLMTPEPDGGIYTELGTEEFVRQFGYKDKKGRPNRMNFGGRHLVNKICKATNLVMHLKGFDPTRSKVTDANGAIALVDDSEIVAASWSFPKIMNHWKKKHSQAVYIPSMRRTTQSGDYEYYYGNNIVLGTGANFEIFLSAMAKGYVYYDPGIKLENISNPKPKLKKRNQLRVKLKHLENLYHNLEFLDIAAKM
jgi:hypothetical protein